MLKLFLLFILFSTLASTNEDIDLNIDELLFDIEKKTDLSQITKLENSGISVIYTREDIQRMQARYLKDILKSSSTFGYNENRYGLPDPLNHGDFVPFMSGIIRIFIDNQEMTGGMYGSGLIIYGDIDIGFVDHIEVYTQSPTYEYSTEPTMMLIKLYSKSVLKDSGSNLEVNFDSFKSSRISGYNSQEFENGWSYFSYISLDNNNRQKYNPNATELSRDKKTGHAFVSIKNENHNIIIDAISYDKDAFIGSSLDATPTKNKLDTDSLHVGYDGGFGNISLLASYDYLEAYSDFEDDVLSIGPGLPVSERKIHSVSHIATAGLKYKFNVLNNRLITGIKYRCKKYEYKTNIINGVKFPERKNNTQTLTTAYIEDQYSIMDNLILTAGVQYVNVKNRDALYNENNDLLLYRFGLTYLYNNWTIKTIGSHTESSLEPYLVDEMTLVVSGEIDNQTSDNIYADIIYKHNFYKYEFVFGYMIYDNYLLPSQSGKLDSYENSVYATTLIFRYELDYNKYDKLFSEISYMGVDNIFNTQKYDFYKVVLRNLNTYEKFDNFNEIIYDKNSIFKEDYYDYSAGIIYNYTNDISMSIKAEDILNKAVKSGYFIVSPTTFQSQEPLRISPIDRKITLSMDYTF